MASRFSFRFETLLKLRKQREEQCRRVVATRLSQIMATQSRRAEIEDQIARQSGAFRRSLKSDMLDVDEVRLSRHWLLKLRQRLFEADAEVAGQHAVLAQERAALAVARKDTKVLETLRERQYSTFVAQVQRREQLELDELNVTRFAHAAMTNESENP
ncbi:MAG: flagellar FliJ family protein [Planctomycetia bacterium]|nr:flagellar FliJ family protein [Planctomycetia bacterium]